MKRTVAVILLIVSAVLSSSPRVHSEQQTYKVLVPILDELKLGYLTQVLTGFADVYEKKYGKKAAIEEVRYTYGTDPVKIMLDRMNAGEADFALVYPTEYHYYLLNKDSNAVPLVGLEVFGSKYANVCFYTRKEDGVKDIEELRGKNWAGVHTRNVRYLLFRHGTDMPADEFLGKMIFHTEIDSSGIINMLLSGEIDTFTLTDAQLELALNANSEYRDAITGVGCEKYFHNWLVVYRKELPEELVKSLQKTLLEIHDDPDFAGYRYVFRIIQGKFVPINPQDVYSTMKIAVQYQNAGWMDEEIQFIKENMPPKNGEAKQ